jgi:hypothetical protein
MQPLARELRDASRSPVADKAGEIKRGVEPMNIYIRPPPSRLTGLESNPC